MLENIKLVLGIKTEEYDSLITLKINQITDMVLDYCNLDKLSKVLEAFVEDKVISIVKGNVSGGGSTNDGTIKSVTRGDTRIEYNVGGEVEFSVPRLLFTDAEMEYLDMFVKTSGASGNGWRLF